MAYIDKITTLEKCTEGLSPAEVYQCYINGNKYFLKKIDNIFSSTTYSVRREAEVMRWLADKFNVPIVLENGQRDNEEYLIMSEIKGIHIDELAKEPIQYLSYLVKALKLLWGVDISGCPFSSRLDVRLKELEYLLEHNLADVNSLNWQEYTEFATPEELFQWLCKHRPQEEFVFSHGDIGANLFVIDDEIYFYDLARCGIADKWNDIAFCVRDIREYYPDSDYESLFYEMLGIEPDYEKINYYLLLDELF